LLAPLATFCQRKNDTKIVVISKDTSNLLNRIALALVNKDYSLIEKDNDIKFIATSAKPLKTIVASSRLKVLVQQGSTIVITGLIRWDYRRGAQLITFNPVDYVPNKGIHKNTAPTIIWREMMDIAQQFGDEIAFAK
jgi:hypothetical protein